MAPVIIVFAKAPVPGQVKSRLTPHRTRGEAAALQRAFAADLLDRIIGIADVELHTDVPCDDWREFPVSRKLQLSGDLGQRMLAALDDALSAGRPVAMILGSDVPSLPASHVRELLESPADVTLGPSEDGGYWAIAARRTHPAMFRGVEWSSTQALKQTGRACQRCGLTVSLGPLWYDVDRPEDLRRLAAGSESIPRTRRVLASIQISAMALKEGDRAPDLTLDTDSGEKLKLSSLKGKNVVLYFYPKSDTPGCTTEACEFRDSSRKFDQAGAVIIGISPDAVKAQTKFKTKYDLPFTLLADAGHAAAEAYGVWQEKSMYGRKYFGVARTTFIIGKDGRIKKIFEKVKPAGHAAKVLEALVATLFT